MNWQSHYERWNLHKDLDDGLKTELNKLTESPALLEEAFYKTLEFGTGGMRGEIGPGINRMNIYTVRRAAKGLSGMISQKGDAAKRKGVVISYDNRHFSREFAVEAARVLGTDGIKVYVFNELRPTPQLSFAVRKLKTVAGIMITASHNPPEYNGFKVYGEDGAQLVGEDSDILLQLVNDVADELLIPVDSEKNLTEKGILEYVGNEMDEAYIEKLLTVVKDGDLVHKSGSKLSIVFTPLHGASTIPVTRGFEKAGFTNVKMVKSQTTPDPDFTHVSSANPEDHVAFDRAMKQGEEEGADVLIATDPDGDRVGVAAKNLEGNYQVLTGNQTGALLLHYLLSTLNTKNALPKNGVMIQTIVTSPLGKAIAQAFNIESLDVLTGFKYIAEKIREFEGDGSQTFLFGYEESYGYLIEPFARDKDAVQAALLVSEVALYYKLHGKTLFEALNEIYKSHGYYYETLRSFVFKGKEGLAIMSATMEAFRKESLKLEHFQLQLSEDYLKGIAYNYSNEETKDIDLPKSNVLKYIMADGSWVCLRPSGTEPKLKLYFGVKGDSTKEAQDKMKKLVEPVIKQLEALQ
ncbi:phospho-sugar mutase [Evansella tamaricis]|uniref:phosphoglucomutase (alpha-D-glucose-1,6-bisphosphate-dependent) n=1 Tax=Evansella tamaricis TaxID=2069301 RepID=A0ABS6JJ18_9BACI|nr:phospho-sugar mutase [Evansella tamaricis]MBU9712837.1 phospho-sugar mutase [Evansella tamaricis]